MGIRRRILLSFLALFLIVFVAATILSTFLAVNAVEERLQVQTQDLARLIAPKHGMLNPVMRDFIKQAYGAESVRDDEPGAPAPGAYVYRASLGPMNELIITYRADVVSKAK